VSVNCHIWGNLIFLDHSIDKRLSGYRAHEMGYYDLPASINYILETTGNRNLFYIGHSMGCTVFYMMAASKPEFCDKVKAMISLAPAAYGKHTNRPLKSSAAVLSPLVIHTLLNTGHFNIDKALLTRKVLKSN